MLQKEKSRDWYKSIWSCASCHHVLSDQERYYSDAVCPYCGWKDPRALTIVSCTQKIAIWVWEPNRRWWQFWKPKGFWKVIRGKP